MNILSSNASLAPVILRVTTGLLLLSHGVPKLAIIGPFLSHVPFPAPLNLVVGILTIAVEVIGGLMLVAGFRARLAGLATAILFFGISFVVHGAQFADLFNMNPADGQTQFEYPFLIGVAGLVVALLGSGKFAAKQD